jgi:hypothetical protein
MVGDRTLGGDKARTRPMPGNSVDSPFDRRLLPKPADYYAGEGVKLLGRSAWRDAHARSTRIRARHIAGAHRDRRISLHGVRGAWRRRAGALHMRRHALRFIDAAKSLGAWSAP